MEGKYSTNTSSAPSTSNISTINKWVSDAEGTRGSWESDITKWYKLRMRVKKEKNYPFPNCSNIRMPTLDIKIKKLKAQIRNGILGVRPVVQVVPSPGGNYNVAHKIEKLIDHLLIEIIKYEQLFLITIDQTLEIGFYLNKPYWRLEIQKRNHTFDIADVPFAQAIALFQVDTKPEQVVDYLVQLFAVDKNKYVWYDNHETLLRVAEKILEGSFNVKFSTRDVTYNYPDIALVHPDKCYVRNDGGFHPQTQPYIVTESWFTLDELKQIAEHQDWSISGITETISASELNSQLESVKAAKEGISAFTNTGKIRIYEAQGYLNGKKQIIITAPDFNVELKVQSLPLPSGKYNIVKFYHELRDNRWYHHRGLPEILEDLVKEIDVQHMQKIDRQTLVNSPIFMFRAGMINPQTMQATFGQLIPVNGMQPLNDVLQQVNNYNQAADFSYDREQQILKSDIDEYTGQIDFTLSQQLNRREPRTAEEVQRQSSSAAMVTSLDLSIFRSSFEELANFIFELWCEYGDEEYEFKYFGGATQETIKLNKEELQGKYLIKIRANDENYNMQNRVAKAQSILQAVGNPLALQLGIVTPTNVANAYKRYFQELNIDQAEELYTMPQPKEPGVPDRTIPKFEDLEEIEQAQVLTKLGIKPNVMARLADKERAIKNERSDNLVNIINTLK